jgi:hypothetical protein
MSHLARLDREIERVQRQSLAVTLREMLCSDCGWPVSIPPASPRRPAGPASAGYAAARTGVLGVRTIRCANSKPLSSAR